MSAYLSAWNRNFCGSGRQNQSRDVSGPSNYKYHDNAPEKKKLIEAEGIAWQILTVVTTSSHANFEAKTFTSHHRPTCQPMPAKLRNAKVIKNSLPTVTSRFAANQPERRYWWTRKSFVSRPIQDGWVLPGQVEHQQVGWLLLGIRKGQPQTIS